MLARLLTSWTRYLIAAVVLIVVGGAVGLLVGAWIGRGFSQPVATFGAGALVLLGALVAFTGQMIINETNKSQHVDERELHLLTLRVDLYATMLADADLITNASPSGQNDRIAVSPVVRRAPGEMETVLARFENSTARLRVIGGEAVYFAANNFQSQFHGVRHLHMANTDMGQDDRAQLFSALQGYYAVLVARASADLRYTKSAPATS